MRAVIPLFLLAAISAAASVGMASASSIDAGKSSLTLTCQSITSIGTDPFGIWKDSEISDAKDEGWNADAKVCVGKSERGENSFTVSMLIGSGCSASLCPVRVIKSDANKRRRVLKTDMMCASTDFYSLSSDGKNLRACDQDFSLDGKS